MSHLIRALRAEQVKLRHTLSLWLVPLAPMVIVLPSYRRPPSNPYCQSGPPSPET